MTAATLAPAGDVRSAEGALAGTGLLTRLALRRDRVSIPAWVLSLAVIVVATAYSVSGIYGTAAKRASLAAGMAGNSSMRALYGPLYADSAGGLTSWRTIAFGTALAGLMGAFVVVRHTREEEEAGRLELIGAGAVGRRAPLAAALLAALTAAGALTVVVTVSVLPTGRTGRASTGWPTKRA